MHSGLDVNKTVNSRINLIFVAAFYPKSSKQWSQRADMLN